MSGFVRCQNVLKSCLIDRGSHQKDSLRTSLMTTTSLAAPPRRLALSASFFLRYKGHHTKVGGQLSKIIHFSGSGFVESMCISYDIWISLPKYVYMYGHMKICTYVKKLKKYIYMLFPLIFAPALLVCPCVPAAVRMKFGAGTLQQQRVATC